MLMKTKKTHTHNPKFANERVQKIHFDYICERIVMAVRCRVEYGVVFNPISVYSRGKRLQQIHVTRDHLCKIDTLLSVSPPQTIYFCNNNRKKIDLYFQTSNVDILIGYIEVHAALKTCAPCSA